MKYGYFASFKALISFACGYNLMRFELAATTGGGTFSPGLNMLGLVSFSDKKRGKWGLGNGLGVRMAYASFRDFCAAAELASADQFDKWRSDWDSARSQNGSAETGDAEKNPVGSFFECVREKSGKSEADFLSLVGQAFNWKVIDLSEEKPTTEARRKIPSKVAYQHRVVPVSVEEDGVLVVAASNPFDRHLLNAVRFAAQGPVKFALATSDEVAKSYEKNYGVGADTIDEMAEDYADKEEKEEDK